MRIAPEVYPDNTPSNDLENDFLFLHGAAFDYADLKDRLQERLRTIDLIHAAEAARVQKLILYVEHRAAAVGACV